jgi:tetratricopeptide (TPR) repeat protein
MSTLPRRSTLLWVAAGFLLLSIAIYGASLRNEFVRWDDGSLIYENAAVRQISLRSLKTFFTTYDPELYIPLTFLVYQIDFAIGGTDTVVYHLTNLLLHTVNALLVAWLALLLTRRKWAALLAGLLFAVHPLHTEAVAWASALKDVLSTAFFLGSLVAYLYYIESERRKHYIVSLLLFALGLLSKVMVITLPIVLFLVDFQQGRRWNARTFLEKIPYLALSVLFGIIALYGKEAIIREMTPLQSVLLSVKSVIFALTKLFFPFGLSVLYPYTDPITISSPAFFVPALVLAALLALTVVSLRWTREIFFGVAFFLITIAPTFTNLSKGEIYLFSDRYAYIPSIGILLLVALGIEYLRELPMRTRAKQQWQIGLSVVIGLVLVGLSVKAYAQSFVWRDTESLFRNVIAFYPNSYFAHNNLGNAYRRKDKLDEAVSEFKKSIAIKPHVKTLSNLAAVERKQGLIDEALATYDRAKQLDPESPLPYLGLGLLYDARGEFEKALAAYAKALELDPSNAEVYINRGALYMDAGDVQHAITEYKRAIELQPFYATAHFNLALAYEQTGETALAEKEYLAVIALQPSYVGARINLGILEASIGKLREARAQFEAILKIDPSNTAARAAVERLDAALRQSGQ